MKSFVDIADYGMLLSAIYNYYHMIEIADKCLEMAGRKNEQS